MWGPNKHSLQTINDGPTSRPGFDIRSAWTLGGKPGVRITPKMKARTNLLLNLKAVFRRFTSQPVQRVIELINPKLRVCVNYFRIGHFSRCLSYVKDWVEKKIVDIL